MNKPRHNTFSIAKDEILLLKNCPQCGENLNERWFTREEQESLKNEDAKLFQDQPANWWTQIRGGICSRCLKFYPKYFYKDYECEDISYQEEKQKYSREKELVKKIITSLLPRQDIRVRFVKSYGEGSIDSYSLACFYAKNHDKNGKLVGNEVLSILFAIELIVEKEKKNPGFFCEAIAHELAHACHDVWKNPQFKEENLPNCDCQVLYPDSSKAVPGHHKGNGHDKLWHDKHNEFRERIKNENLATGSGYSSLGKEFIFKKINENDIVFSSDGKRLQVNKISLDDITNEDSKASTKKTSQETHNEQENQEESKNNKTIWITSIILGTVLFLSLLYWLWKRKTKKIKNKNE